MLTQAQKDAMTPGEWVDYCRGSGGTPPGCDSAEERREREKRGYHGGPGDPHTDPSAAIRRL